MLYGSAVAYIQFEGLLTEAFIGARVIVPLFHFILSATKF